MYTSKNLSQKLKEGGCELGALKKHKIIKKDGYKLLPMYDILWDICIKFSKEFFGNSKIAQKGISQHILYLLQQGKQQEAEDYIYEHCLFNPKNKV